MSKMGRTSKIESVLNKSLDAGPVKRLSSKYYCPNCYDMNLVYRQVEKGVFDIACLTCHTHWTKTKKK